MRVWLYCFIVYIKILSYSRQSLLTKQQIRLEVTIISQQVYSITDEQTQTFIVKDKDEVVLNFHILVLIRNIP